MLILYQPCKFKFLQFTRQFGVLRCQYKGKNVRTEKSALLLLSQLVRAYGAGANLLAVDQDRMTALHHGAICGHKDVVKYLIDYGEFSSGTLAAE